MQQALSGGPITVYGDGLQVRCFAHVSDVVEAICRLTRCEGAVGGIFNVGSDQPVTILRLAELVRELVNPAAEIVHVPYEQAYGPGFEDIRVRVPDVRKIMRTIEFRPAKGLDEILLDVREYLAAE